MIKIATLDDLDNVLSLAEEFYNKTPYTDLEFNFSKTSESLSKIIENPNEESIILMSEDNSSFIAGIVVEPLFSNEKIAIEVAFYSRNTRGKTWFSLLQSYIYWANTLNCTAVQSGSLLTKYGTFLEKQGFKKRETIYQKDL